MQYRQAIWAILTNFCVEWLLSRSVLLGKILTLEKWASVAKSRENYEFLGKKFPIRD